MAGARPLPLPLPLLLPLLLLLLPLLLPPPRRSRSTFRIS
jgi:hypothetical protein